MNDKDSLRIILEQRDGGPLYTETDLDKFIVEPWNTASAILFLVVAIFWFIKLRQNIKQHKFLFWINILLLIGSVGGTIYHAFRASRVFIMMDWMPIMIIIFAMSFYFFIKATKKWWPPLVLFAFIFVLNGISFRVLHDSLEYKNIAISISYVMMGLAAIIPVIINLSKTKMYRSGYFFIALLSLIIAVVSRSIDEFIDVPMGTHFLWHVFGAIGTYFIFYYVYIINNWYRSNQK